MGDLTGLERALRAELRGAVDFGAAQRAVYAYDASNYRQVPVGVVRPASLDDVRAALALARQHGVPLLARGAGTSIGGQAVSPGALVLDFRHGLGGLDAEAVDPGARTARVRPGTVLDQLQAAAAPHGLAFGPDPSTHSRCTLGGMIGNNSCGPHSVAFGRTSDNVRSLDLLLPDGTELTVGGPLDADARAALAARPGREGELHRTLQGLVAGNLALLRRAFPPLPRRGSGYDLEALLPERGYDLARALTGTEGTCALLLGATVALAPLPRERALVVAGYADETAAADAVLDLLPLRPLTAEGMGADLIRTAAARELLPAGGGWLLLEAEAGEPARALAEAARAQGATVRLLTDPAQQRALWRVREAAAGTATRAPDGSEAWPGWEDSAVPPQRLGAYLRELRQLLRQHGLHGTPYGHFGEGCVHLRLDLPLDRAAGSGPGDDAARRFLTEAADLVVSLGGSPSGEHGDGQARGELLARAYPPEVLALFARFKAAFDPATLLNPGNLVDPRPLDADLRQPALRPELPLADGARRCVGVGACVADEPAAVMCPSYAVTREERHSTRGRARLLGELLRGLGEPDGPVGDGWRSEEVAEALDLCLSCKGCASDCPVHVDMASYKSEFLDRHWRGRLRPRHHYLLGGLPRLLRLLHAVPGAAPLARAALRVRPPARLAALLAGTERRRALPAPAARPFSRGYRPPTTGSPLLLWPDTFGEHLDPDVLDAGATVLARLGHRPLLPPAPVCCGLTQLSTGRLAAARRTMARSLRVLAGMPPELPVVVLEPSCAATLREELPRHLPDDPAARQLAARVRTLAEFLDETGSAGLEVPPGLRGALAQTHCHQHAVLGVGADDRLSERLGLGVRRLPPSCCGLAGNFAFEPGHHEVSVAVAERVLLPALRAEPEAAVLADGYSCRTQIAQLTEGRRARHLAQLLRDCLPTDGSSLQ